MLGQVGHQSRRDVRCWGGRKLLETSVLLVVTMFAISNKCLMISNEFN